LIELQMVLTLPKWMKLEILRVPFSDDGSAAAP
jgi:hypothetical protein